MVTGSSGTLAETDTLTLTVELRNLKQSFGSERELDFELPQCRLCAACPTWMNSGQGKSFGLGTGS